MPTVIREKNTINFKNVFTGTRVLQYYRIGNTVINTYVSNLYIDILYHIYRDHYIHFRSTIDIDHRY